jgi:hypothetical protein
MPQNLSEENLIRHYLLGQLSENEQDALEEQLLTDPKFFEISLIIEGELLDEYVMGSLSEADRMKVESGLLIDEQQQRKVQLISLLRLKSNASTSAEKQSTDFFSGSNRYFSLRSRLDRVVWWAA